MNDFKFVMFEDFCPDCKHKDAKDYEDPCNECLEYGAREGTYKPLHYEEKESKK